MDLQAYLAIEEMIAAEGYDLTAADAVFDLECRLSHFDSSSFSFVAACYDAAVIVAENNDGTVFESGIECTLAADEEVVAIGEAYHSESGLGIKY